MPSHEGEDFTKSPHHHKAQSGWSGLNRMSLTLTRQEYLRLSEALRRANMVLGSSEHEPYAL